ncbi:hypothetical protein Tco_1010650 [Tanacetum coccineum]
MVRLVKHGLEEFGFESESQLDHEMVDRFFVVVVKVVLECRHWKGYYVYQEWLRFCEVSLSSHLFEGCRKVVRWIDDEFVEEVEVIHFGKKMMVFGWMFCASTLVLSTFLVF